jgi:hypothetical protein
MRAPSAQSPRPGWRFWFSWILATVAGAAAGLVLSIPWQAILELALPANLAPPWTASQTALIVLLKGAEGGMLGLGLGLGQWLALRRYLPRSGGWILATGLACLAQGAFRWLLPAEMPPWQVGVAIFASFGVFFGVCQWLVLRERLPHAGWWIAINMAGWLPALALVAGGPSVESDLDILLAGIAELVPFAVTGAGMIWLLRQPDQVIA